LAVPARSRFDGFVDGSENPSLIDAPEAALIAEGAGAGGDGAVVAEVEA